MLMLVIVLLVTVVTSSEALALDAPTGVSASVGTYANAVHITWNGVIGAFSYEVYRATWSKGYKTVVRSWGIETSYDDTTAIPGLVYWYWVKARTVFGLTSGYSSYNWGWRKLSAPTGVSASDGRYTDKVYITWGNVWGASYYQVYRAESSGGTKTALGIWQTGISYNDTSGMPGTTYYYWVRAATTPSTRASDYSSYDSGWSGGALRYVDVAATGTNDGTSWTNAYNYLQDALGKVGVGDEIRVAEGTYRPDQGSGVTSGDRDVSFHLRNDVAIYGGFPSGGGDWEHSNPDRYQTILSGDLNGDDGADFANNGENSYHVVTGYGIDENAILDGFTVTAGNANAFASVPHNAGGGMRNESGYPTVRNCTFTGNSAVWGGGIENFNASPVIADCTFSGNFAGYGGGVNNYNSNMLLTNCTFIGNSAVLGGGMHSRNSSSPTITNCTFAGNTADSWGGGILNRESSSPILTNCILWGNSDSGGTDESAQIYNASSTLVINYSCVQGWSGGLGGTGNIGDDPVFVDANGPDDIVGTEDDNLRLSEGSTCIEAGDNTAVPVEVETDLDGHPRIIDGDCDDSEIVDMGAYEFNYAYMGDFDYNCEVNFGDFAILGMAWLTEPPDENWNQFCDISIPADNKIDWADVEILSDNWLAGH